MRKTKGSKLWAKRKSKKFLGKHFICEFWGGKIIKEEKRLKKILWWAAKHSKSTPLKFCFHKFNPGGITGVLLLAESHISYHSWPEYHFAAVDIFTCGKETVPQRALFYLKKVLNPEKVKVKEIKRGKV